MTQADATEPAPTILVVETDIVVRHVIADYLRGCGYRVLEAANGDEASLILDVEAETIDIVLADAAATGDREGFALARWLRETHPQMDVILAGSPAMAAAQATDLCEDGPVVDKPYQPQQLADRIRWLVARRARNR